MRAAARASKDCELTAAHPWYAVKRGWVYTLDQKAEGDTPVIRPMPSLEYLEAITELWVQCPKGLLGKSRQMIISWLFAWLELWDATYHDGRHCLFQGKRLEDVDATNTHRILGRARFIRDRLPTFLRPQVVSENLKQETYANGSTLEAIPEGQDVIRSKVPSSLAMDEIAFHETSEQNWDAALASSKKQWGITTPNGHEFVYRQAEPGHLWDDWRDWPKICEGVHSYQTRNGVQLVALHYTADPANRTVEAQTKRREGYSSEQRYLRENELNFSLPEGLPVYANDFSKAVHVIPKYIPDPRAPIIRGWDPSYNGQAVGWYQFNLLGQLVWFDALLLKGVPLERVCQEVQRRTLTYTGGTLHKFDGPEPAVIHPMLSDYGDPAALQHNTQGETVEATLTKFGIRLITKATQGRKVDIVEQVRTLLLNRSDGRPGMIIATNTTDMSFVVAAFAGGYHYGEQKEGKAAKLIPHKDGVYDHLMDQCQYVVDNVKPIQFAVTDTSGAEGEWWRADPGVGSDMGQ